MAIHWKTEADGSTRLIAQDEKGIEGTYVNVFERARDVMGIVKKEGMPEPKRGMPKTK